jgi:hypothetical protein
MDKHNFTLVLQYWILVIQLMLASACCQVVLLDGHYRYLPLAVQSIVYGRWLQLTSRSVKLTQCGDGGH